MQQARRTKKIRERLTYANVMSTFAAFVALSGATAFAASALPKNSVGSRQIKAKAITSGKLANGAVNAAKVAAGSLTGANINLSQLGTVPRATSAKHAEAADVVDGHSIGCPANTTQYNGLCFDSSPNPPVSTLKQAADACAANGGFLPSATDLYAARSVLSLGTGIGSDRQYTNIIYGDTNGGNYRTIVIDGSGAISEAEINVPSRYTCAYSLVH
jgi:hypothetical protein